MDYPSQGFMPGRTMTRPYVLADSPYELEIRRLRGLERELGPTTTRHLAELGVAAGWRCLEVGAGAGGVARWLVDRVGPEGRVVATDIDPRFLDAERHPGLEIRRHDITADDLEEG